MAGLLLTLAVPRLPGLGANDLEAAAERLASTMTWLADESSLRGRIYRLTIDLDREGWEVAALAPFAASRGASAKGVRAAAATDGSDGGQPIDDEVAAFAEDPDDEMARRIALPDGVSFEAVVDDVGESSAGASVVWFLPEGTGAGVRVRLAERGGARAAVVFDPARGFARVEDVAVDAR